jgi:hypothetical protein
VEKGEIFEKLGRTMRWYLVKIDDETSGWISGRTIRRYQEARAPDTSPPGVPFDDRYYPYDPGDYYGYSYNYYGVQPYFSGEWYFYGGEPYWGYNPPRGDRWRIRSGPHPGGGSGPRFYPRPLPPAPRHGPWNAPRYAPRYAPRHFPRR